MGRKASGGRIGLTLPTSGRLRRAESNVRDMVFLAITPKGLAEAIKLAKASSSPVWCGSDAIDEAEYSNRTGVNLSRFIYPLSAQPQSAIEGAIETISEHHPEESIWVEFHVAP